VTAPGQGREPALQNRRRRLLEAVAGLGAEGILVTHLPHIRYLSGFTGSSGVLLLFADNRHFLTDGRYTEQARQEVQDIQIHIATGDTPGYEEAGPIASLREAGLLDGPDRIAIESEHLSVQRLATWRALFPQVQWVETTRLVEGMAVIKDEVELANLREAVRITDLVFEEILNDIRPGVRERDIAARIGYLLKVHDSEGEGFETIVAGGPRSAQPHARPSDRALESGDLVVLDFGARVNGYHADMTRTVCLAPASDRHHEIYGIVLEAQLRGISTAAEGIPVARVDAACRDHINTSGYRQNFPHATGHGVGLEVHTAPRISKSSREVLQAGMVVTIEPGIYLREWGGVRIEDDVLVGPDASTPLNRSTKDFLVLGA
jgi:Xaa-Pro aminopeptidase